jgi:hypothetical protein
MWFDETIGDDSYASMKTMAREIGESGANCGYSAGTCYVNEGSSDCYSYVAASANKNCAKEDELGEIAFE